MFDNYTYKSSGLKYNITKDLPAILKEVNLGPLVKTTDRAGNLICVSWYHNNIFDLTDTLDMHLFVESDARVYTDESEIPDEHTFGEFHQKAYNTASWKCWLCNGVHRDLYEWGEIPLLECINGTMLLTFKFNKVFKNITCNILNFRREILYTYEQDTSDILIHIDPKDQPLMVEGQYFLEIYLNTDDTTQHIKTIPITIK